MQNTRSGNECLASQPEALRQGLLLRWGLQSPQRASCQLPDKPIVERLLCWEGSTDFVNLLKLRYFYLENVQISGLNKTHLIHTAPWRKASRQTTLFSMMSMRRGPLLRRCVGRTVPYVHIVVRMAAASKSEVQSSRTAPGFVTVNHAESSSPRR